MPHRIKRRMEVLIINHLEDKMKKQDQENRYNIVQTLNVWLDGKNKPAKKDEDYEAKMKLHDFEVTIDMPRHLTLEQIKQVITTSNSPRVAIQSKIRSLYESDEEIEKLVKREYKTTFEALYEKTERKSKKKEETALEAITSGAISWTATVAGMGIEKATALFTAMGWKIPEDADETK